MGTTRRAPALAGSSTQRPALGEGQARPAEPLGADAAGLTSAGTKLCPTGSCPDRRSACNRFPIRIQSRIVPVPVRPPIHRCPLLAGSRPGGYQPEADPEGQPGLCRRLRVDRPAYLAIPEDRAAHRRSAMAFTVPNGAPEGRPAKAVDRARATAQESSGE